MNSLLPDYHIHTKLCNHAEGEMEEYVERALLLGLKEIGFSDHMPVMPEPHLCMTYDELPGYVSRVCQLREQYKGRISIKLGCEMDMVNMRIDEIQDILHTYPFDYCIGSLHYLDSWPFDQEQYRNGFERGNIDVIFKRFFDAVISAIETGIYDIVGHIDNIKCMGFRPTGDITEQYERIASVLKACNMVFELNTSGFDKPCREQYPSREFLNVLHQYDIPVTVGSDSHSPKHIGRYFERAFSLLEEAGYESVVYFDKRKKIVVPLYPPDGYGESGHPYNGSRMS